MKSPICLVLFVVVIFLTAFSKRQEHEVDFSCLKKHVATNTCHFNFTVDGVPYRFVDMGCKYEKKKEEVIEKAKEGNLALAKDWKISCPVPKSKETKSTSPGF
jgi:hypothetical protein